MTCTDPAGHKQRTQHLLSLPSTAQARVLPCPLSCPLLRLSCEQEVQDAAPDALHASWLMVG
jgi:hypothetical protein